MYCFHCGNTDSHVIDGNGLCYCCAFDHLEGSDVFVFFCRLCGKPFCIGSCQRCQVHVQAIECTCEVTLLLLTGGYTLCTRNSGYDQLRASIRFYDKEGRKLVDWEARHFADEPEQTMAAFLHILLEPSLLENYHQTGSDGFIVPARMQEECREQVIYTSEDNYDLRSGGEDYDVGSYICFRVRGDSSDDGEIVYWDKREWQVEPAVVIGAMLSCIQEPLQLGRHLMRKQNHLHQGI